MNSVERVVSICKERKIPISRLEKDLGFGNGYIGQLKKGSLPAERLLLIAQYFDVSAEYLISGVNEETQVVEKIRVLCREKGTSITKLEAKLGFGNGTIGRWKTHSPSIERIRAVADELGVSTAYLLGEETRKELVESDELSSANSVERVVSIQTSDIYYNIMRLCYKKGITPSKLCSDIGVSKSLVSELKAGRKNDITGETAKKIADYFGVSVDRVITGKEKLPTNISEEKRAFIELLDNLSDEQIAKLHEIAKAALAL